MRFLVRFTFFRSGSDLKDLGEVRQRLGTVRRVELRPPDIRVVGRDLPFVALLSRIE